MRHIASSQVNPPAPQEPPMAAAAGRLLSALADVLQVAKLQGIEAPRLIIGDLSRWAFEQRCIGTCANCYVPFVAAPGARLCPQCAVFLESATTAGGASC